MKKPERECAVRRVTRREVLRAGAAGALLAALPGCGESPKPPISSGSTPVSEKPRGFRFVHFNDIHVQRELDGHKGFAKALQAVETLRPRPDFILTGGDLVFDVFETPVQRARELFTLYKQVIADNTSLRVYPCLGNHDVFGWRSEGVGPGTPGYGKALAMDFLGMSQPYYQFDHGGWRFFVLDNIETGKQDKAYRGALSPSQMEWFAGALRQTPAEQPVIVCEHIPLISVIPYAWDNMSGEGVWKVGSNLVCEDATKRLPLLQERRVRLCLSGHMHERERIEFGGTTFINDGAVCGGWWKGPFRNVQEGFGIIDVRPDGSFDHQYFDYGWDSPAA